MTVLTALAVAGLVMSHPPALSTRAASSDAGSRGVLGSPAPRLLLRANVCAGACLGALTVGLPARAAESGSAAGAGWMFACLGLGSALDGARLGTRERAVPPATGYLPPSPGSHCSWHSWPPYRYPRFSPPCGSPSWPATNARRKASDKWLGSGAFPAVRPMVTRGGGERAEPLG
ncbi:hypothetical protein [Streptomyces malaysiensis]|uniref:hypothetical protein n=1 Tax=Streptomyces malaysiensis TaxID=92644 RepID=UPI00142F1D44|nr:hypothetical protein [Streptomyces malaysiensis]